MNGQMQRYKESLKYTPGPIDLEERPFALDIPGLVRYARLKNVPVHLLTEEEKEQFIIKK